MKLGFSATDDLALLPSPDGRWIAAAETTFDAGADRRHTRLTFVDAPDGAARFASRELPDGEWLAWMEWSAKGTLFVSTIAGRWFELADGGAMRAVAPRSGVCAPTTSSDIDSTGQRVRVEREGELVIEVAGSDLARPCFY